jgi:hypothetical protein
LLRSATPAQPSHFQAHHLDVKFVLRSDLSLQALERGAVKLLDLPTTEAR